MGGHVGNRSQRVDQLGTHTYGYYNLYRLTRVTYPGPSTDSYTYDANGNRLTKNATTYSYDTADRLTATGGVSYVNDNNGNLITRGADTFAWDAEDRMTSASVGGTATTFAYNGDGLRNSHSVSGNTTTFTWDVSKRIAQLFDDGTFKYVHGLGRIAEIGPGTTTHYYLPDGLGSIMALVDATGTVVNTYHYDVFGAVRSSTGSQPNEFRFTGEQYDNTTAFQYLRARYYDPSTARFLSRDRWPANPNIPQSLHDYSYVANNPIIFTDASGWWCPKNPKDCIPDRETLSRLQKPTVLTLDVLAIGFQGASAVITDVATVAGCVAGTPAGPGGVLAGCMAGYLLGRSATTGFRFAGNVASATSTAVCCIPLGENPPEKETKSPSLVKECGFSLSNTIISTIIQDPNVGLASDIYQFCRDLGKCGP